MTTKEEAGKPPPNLRDISRLQEYVLKYEQYSQDVH